MNKFPRRADVSILALLCFISFFSFLDVVDIDLMEARNFVTAREMISESNWLIPTMNGEIRLEKPPMPTWFAAGSTMLAGTNDNLTLLRLPSALAACLLIFSIYGLSWAIGRNTRQAFLSAAMLSTSVLAIDLGRTGSWDIFCHAFMAAALWALWTGLNKRTGYWYFVVSGVCFGLSFMSKGPVSFYAIFLPFSIAYTTVFGLTEIKRQWRGLTLTLVICLLLSCWWPLYILIYHADFALLVAQKESKAWTNRHLQPFWYYWHFLVFTGCWLIWAFAALLKPYASRRVENKQHHTFFLLWLAAALILLSLVPEKKERYLLPAMIPLFYLAGDLAHGVIKRFTENRDHPADRRLVLAHVSLVSILSLVLPLALIFFLKKQGYSAEGAILCYTVTSWTIVFFLIRFFRRRQVERLILTTLAFLALTTLTVLNYYGVLTTKNSAYKPANGHMINKEINQTKIYFLGEPVDMRVIWDLGRQVYPWQPQEVIHLLEQGKTVAVLSKGDPFPLLPKELQAKVLIRGVDTFDYNKRRPGKHNIALSLLQTQEGKGK